MENLFLVQSLKALDHLNENFPYFFFPELCFFFLVQDYLLVQITSVCVLHHHIQSSSIVLEKCFFVSYHVLVLDRCQNADFIQGIHLISIVQLDHLYLLYGIDLLVGETHSFVNCSESSVSKLLFYLEISQRSHSGLSN